MWNARHEEKTKSNPNQIAFIFIWWMTAYSVNTRKLSDILHCLSLLDRFYPLYFNAETCKFYLTLLECKIKYPIIFRL